MITYKYYIYIIIFIILYIMLLDYHDDILKTSLSEKDYFNSLKDFQYITKYLLNIY